MMFPMYWIADGMWTYTQVDMHGYIKIRREDYQDSKSQHSMAFVRKLLETSKLQEFYL